MWSWPRFRKMWKVFLIIITPLVLLPIVFLDGQNNNESNIFGFISLPFALNGLVSFLDDSGNVAVIQERYQTIVLKFKCAYVILLMAVFWMFEVLPLPITALFPVVLFPFLGIQSTVAVAANYMRETALMFIGGISLALAIQYSGLHKRIALKIILMIGSSQWLLLLGILVTSMSMSCIVVVNTAVAAMMVPIVIGVIESLEETESKEERNKLMKLYFLAVGYGSNIGGTATIIGSQPTLIYKELIEQENIGQDGKYTDLNFATFIAFSMPIAVINLFFTWIILGLIFLHHSKFHSNENRSLTRLVEIISKETTKDATNENSDQTVARLLRAKLDALGEMSFHEWAVIVLITIAVVLWLFREPHVFPGWFSLLPHGYTRIGDSTIAIAILIIMFIVPKEIDYFRGETGGTVLTWEFIQQHFPWHVLFIVGGGLAISDGANASGLSVWFGEQLQGLESFPRHVILLLIVFIISILTELMSNAAAVSLLTPILITLSKRLQLHPLYLSLPGAIACQYAFMLPTANPPNTIVFAAGNMKIFDMVKPGIFLNFTCVAVLYLLNISWGEYVIFNYNTYEYPKP